MPTYTVWQRGVYESQDIEADSIYKAVRIFAQTNVLCLQSERYMACGTSKTNPARFIAEDGSAREFTAYQISRSY